VQNPTDPLRAGFTAAQITALIRDADAIEVGAGLELLDQNLTVLGDITDDFDGGSVSRNSYATLHGTASLSITAALDWANAIVRPYMTLSDATITARFNLGAYYTSAPSRAVKETPVLYAVDGFDILHGLNSPVGEAYAVDTGQAYLTVVGAILAEQGFTTALIDQSAAASVLPAPRVWALDDKTTWLNIINDLLAAVGYMGLWSDWDGRLRAQQYLTPSQRLVEWVYDTDPATSIVLPERTYERDYFNAPNRWVFVRSNNVDGPAPVEGAGIYTFVNDLTGDTSVQARGRVITKVVFVEAADQAGLVSQAQSTIDADTNVQTQVKPSTDPNPLHWHFDRVDINDTAIGQPLKAMTTQWTLPLDGSPMRQEWTVI
jgi:hypothetical protein